ncbi:GNAT family N-acetyltransferase [Paeniglutamicibacter sp. ABSL32-1]|uniref:GNAT family N-acetyltransferase n=1 Tax=Paeniglutamicibacter quisquiliarum TaxID=2849498 RepID=UPI001C2D716E|nr:GNAT family N-acetyltransferase [Paeniglutamicibacter quisquiliarum]MBV1779811.1 GNAT family N-acetyltransferase [Paeniglutamicibacter quisquiliarum]
MTPGKNSASGPYLRPWTDSAADIESILAAFAADDMAGQSGEPVNSEAAARRWVAPWIDPDNNSAVAFAIAKDGTAVGHVMAGAIDRRHDTAWISYWVAPEARGSGLASRATASLAEHCFGTLALFRLELAYRVDNPGSAGVARNAGFRIEGLERAKLRYLDERGMPVRFDVQTCARLRGDGPASVMSLEIRS